MPHPIAYLRRSSAGATDAGPGRVSFDVQRAAVLDMAVRRGDAEPTLLVEWGRSGADASSAAGGTRRGGKRRTYHEVRALIDGGEVSALYAYSLSRLARSTRELLDLAEACVEHHVPIRLAKEGDIDGTTPHGRLYLTVLAAVATFEAEVAGERGKDRNASMRDRGAHVGRAPFGYTIGPDGKLQPVLDEQRTVRRVLTLHRELASPARVARALNAEGIASPTGRAWSDGTVRRILARQPGARPPKTIKGSRAVPVATFARLLYCACGGRLTPARKRFTQKDGTVKLWTGYTCSLARYNASHPRLRAVAEAAVLEAAKIEVARLRVPERLVVEEKAAEEAVELAARRERILDALEAGTMSRGEADGRLAKLSAAAEALEAEIRIVEVPRVDWSWPPERLNPVLAALFERIDVAGPGAVRFTWTVPEWRAA